VAFDAEGAEDDAQRKIHALEDRPLLDVQLEVGSRTGKLASRVESSVEVDTVFAQGIG